MNILIVEDDQFLAEKIVLEFKKNAPINIIKYIDSYAAFLKEANTDIYDVILLDICLWDENFKNNGLAILEHIRKTNTKVPIIIMSNIIQYRYLEDSFRLWAQDYLIKPFRIRELQIRIQRWFHSYVFTEFFSYEKTLNYHEIAFIPSTNEFKIAWEKLDLTKSNKYLFSLFLINREKLLSQNFLSEKIWGYSEETSWKNLRIKILRLKQQLEKYSIGSWIHTIHGEGYLLEKN